MRKIIIGLALIGIGLVAGVLLQRTVGSRLPHASVSAEATNAPVPPHQAKVKGPIVTVDQIEAGLAELGQMSPGYEKQTAVDAFAARLSTNAIPIAAARAAQPELRLEPFFVIKICARWATVDPEAAGKFIVTQPPSEYREKELQNLIDVWAHQNIDSLIAWVEQSSAPDVQRIAFPKLARQVANSQPGRAASIASRISSPIERQLALKTVYERWTQIDPAAASKKLLVVFMPEVPGENFLYQALAAWFAQDAQAPFETLKTTPDNLARRHAIMDTAEIMGGIDPTNVLALISTMPREDSKRLVAIGSLAKSWTVRDPQAAWGWAQSVPDPKEHDMAVQEVLIMLQDRDAEAARDLIQKQPESPGAQTVAANLARRWAEKSPREAFTWANQLSAAATRANAIRGVFQGWMRQSYPEAVKGASELLSGAERQSILASIFQAWTLSDARDAAQHLLQFPLGEEDASIYAGITDMLLNNSLTNTVAWALQLSAGKPRLEAERKIVTFLSRTDPAKAAQFLEKISSHDAMDLADSLMSVWARHDLAAAADWIEHLSDSGLQTVSWRALARNAARTDPATAARLAEKTPPDSDQALSVVAAALAGRRPSSAAEIAESITDADLRWKTFESVASSWLRLDPGRAREWLQTNSLPLARKQLLLQAPH